MFSLCSASICFCFFVMFLYVFLYMIFIRGGSWAGYPVFLLFYVFLEACLFVSVLSECLFGCLFLFSPSIVKCLRENNTTHYTKHKQT